MPYSNSHTFIRGNAILFKFIQQLSLYGFIQIHYVKHEQGGNIFASAGRKSHSISAMNS